MFLYNKINCYILYRYYCSNWTPRRTGEENAFKCFLAWRGGQQVQISTDQSVIPEIQNIMGSLSSTPKDTKSRSCGNGQKTNDQTNGLKTKKNKKDCRFTFDLRDTGNLSSHTQTTKIKFC